jgi:hypothetical protein
MVDRMATRMGDDGLGMAGKASGGRTVLVSEVRLRVTGSQHSAFQVWTKGEQLHELLNSIPAPRSRRTRERENARWGCLKNGARVGIASPSAVGDYEA